MLVVVDEDGHLCSTTHLLRRGGEPGGWEPAGARWRVPVAPSGLVSAPLLVRHGLDEVVCRGLDEDGRVVDVRHHQPLTEFDRGWPGPDLWREPPHTS